MGVKHRLRQRLIDDARLWWRFWSIRLGLTGAALQSWILAAPDSVSWLWSQVPYELREFLPLGVVKGIPIALFVASMAARLFKQRKLEK